MTKGQLLIVTPPASVLILLTPQLVPGKDGKLHIQVWYSIKHN